MIRLLLAAACASLLAACFPSDRFEAGVTASAAPRATAPAATPRRVAKSEPQDPPAEIRISSSVGEVVFHHRTHFTDLAIGCVDCHHQIDAKALSTPHPDYLKSSWISCKTCHAESGTAKQGVYSCSGCHRTTPTHIADETLSAKVVIHRKCWKCHEVGTGKQASEACGTCHSGKKTS